MVHLRRLIPLFLLLTLCSAVYAGPQETSSRTAASIITDARYLLNDNETPYFFDDDEMLRWLNDGMMIISKDGHAAQSIENIDLIAGQREYTPTSDYIRFEAVLYADSDGVEKRLTRGSPAEVGQIRDVGEPTRFYDFDGKLGVYPTLSSATTEKVKVYMLVNPSVLTTSDNVTTPAVFDPALAYYIVAQAFWKDRKLSSHAQAMGKFEAELYKARIELNAVPEP